LKGFLSEIPDRVFEQVPINRRLLEIASEFVEEQKGWWEHPAWEGFLERLGRDGFNLTKEVEPPIGSILEIFKAYYHADRFEAIADKRRKPATRKTAHAQNARPSGKKQPVKQA
jgi:hypothetical protein